MNMCQITWLIRKGFEVQQLTDSGRYMLVRGDRVILNQWSPTGIEWTISTNIGKLRMPLRACIELALNTL